MKINKAIILATIGLAVVTAIVYVSLRSNINQQATHAIVTNDAATLKQCLARGYSVNSSQAITGDTPLHLAAMTSHGENKNEVVEVLIAYGANINACNKAGMTPLHYAAYTGSHGLVKLLIKNGADIKAKSNDGRTPLVIAMHTHNKVAVELMKRQGKQP